VTSPSDGTPGTPDTLVTSILDQIDQDPLEVVWRVRSQDGDYKVVDVMVEGISMALTLREEFSSVSRVRGIDGLIEELRQGSRGPVDDARFAGATRHLLQSAMQPGTFRGLSN
jgi:ABC-type transporter MlaC component